MLPQRRKSPEEIAKLREAMGLSADPTETTAEETAPEPAPAAPVVAAAPNEPEPIPEPRAAKAVKSLRKSERLPLSTERRTTTASAGAIPVRKHSEQELLSLRRQTATPPQQAINMVNQQAARWWMVLLMYLGTGLSAFVGWSSKAFNDLPDLDFPAEWIARLYTSPSTPPVGKWMMVAICALSLGLAAWIAWRKPRSRHHAGFVTIIAVLVITFGIIYHQLPNGP